MTMLLYTQQNRFTIQSKNTTRICNHNYPYASDLADFDYYLFLSIGHALTEHYLNSKGEVEIVLYQKTKTFIRVESTICLKDGKQVQPAMANTLYKMLYSHPNT